MPPALAKKRVTPKSMISNTHTHKITLFQFKVFKKRKQLQELAQPAPGRLVEEASSRQGADAFHWAGARQMPLRISSPGDTQHITGLFFWNTLPSLQYKGSCFKSHRIKRSSAMAIGIHFMFSTSRAFRDTGSESSLTTDQEIPRPGP